MKSVILILFALAGMAEELFIDAMTQRPYDIDGHFVHYDSNDAYGWAYFTLESAQNPPSVKGVYKLEGMDPATGQLQWTQIDSCETAYELASDGQSVTVLRAASQGSVCGLSSDIFKQEQYPVDGHFIHYASQAYDWAYLMADTLQVAKLTGFKNGQLTWELFDNEIFEDITLSPDRSAATFLKRENTIGNGDIKSNPYGMFGSDVRFGNDLLTGRWTLVTLEPARYSQPQPTAYWEFNADGTWAERCHGCEEYFEYEHAIAEGFYGVDESAKQLTLSIQTAYDLESNLTQAYETVAFEDGCYLLQTTLERTQSDALLLCKTFSWEYDFVMTLRRTYLESLFAGINAGNPMNNSGYFGPNVTLAGHTLADKRYDVYSVDDAGEKKTLQMQYYFTQTGQCLYRSIGNTEWFQGSYGVSGSGTQLLFAEDAYRMYAYASSDPACFYLSWYDTGFLEVSTSLQCESNETLSDIPSLPSNYERIRLVGSSLQLHHEFTPANPGVALLVEDEQQLMESFESNSSDLLTHYFFTYDLEASNIDFETQNLLIYRRYIPACPANVVESDPELLENGDYLIRYVEGSRSESFKEERCTYSPGAYTLVSIAYIVDKTIPHIIFRLESGEELIVRNQHE